MAKKETEFVKRIKIILSQMKKESLEQYYILEYMSLRGEKPAWWLFVIDIKDDYYISGYKITKVDVCVKDDICYHSMFGNFRMVGNFRLILLRDFLYCILGVDPSSILPDEYNNLRKNSCSDILGDKNEI